MRLTRTEDGIYFTIAGGHIIIQPVPILTAAEEAANSVVTQLLTPTIIDHTLIII